MFEIICFTSREIALHSVQRLAEARIGFKAVLKRRLTIPMITCLTIQAVLEVGWI